ncbi:MAG: ABC transporter permease [Candidatus Nanopelagicales bacterium]
MIAQAAFELRLLLRNGEQFLLTVVIPLALLLAATFVAAVPLSGAPGTARLPAALGGVLAVAIIASTFTSLAISVGFDRRSGALVMLATTPLSRMSILGARLMATLVVVGLQTLLLVGLSLVLGWRPSAAALALVPVIVLGAACFAALGFALGGAIRAEATLAVANAAFLVLVAVGGTTFPASDLPAPVASVVSFLPSAGLGDLLRWCTGGGPADWFDVATVVVWGVIGAAVARRTFAWR